MMHNTAPRRGLRPATSLLTIVLVVMFGLVGVPAVAVTADDCVPSDGTSDVFSAWTPSGELTPVQHGDSTPPPDPDGEDGEDNPLNLEMIGGPAQQARHVTQEYVPPTPATEGHWTALQWHTWTGGPWESDEAPPLDHDGWHPTQGDPQSENHSVPPRVPNQPYFVSAGGSGKGDWFLWTGTWVPGTEYDPGQAEVSHTDYQWSILTRTFTPGESPVECPSEPPGGGESPGPSDDNGPKGGNGTNGDQSPNPVQVAGKQAALSPSAPARVPSQVAAGLGGTAPTQSDRSPLGLLMVVFGALLAAAAAVRRQARV